MNRDADAKPISGAKTPVASSISRLLLVAGSVLGAFVGCVWRPDALSAVTLIPAWFWALAGAATIVLAIRAERRRTALALLIVWCAFSLGRVEEIRSVSRAAVDRGTSAGTGDRIRIVSLNCAGENCLSDLQAARPDVVLLQEAPASDQLAKLARALFGKKGTFVSTGDAALLARGPIEPFHAPRGGHFAAGIVRLEGGRKINCVSLRLNPPPSRFDFWFPGFWAEHSSCRNAHRRQLRQVLERAQANADYIPIVIGGDFNTVPLDRALDELRPGYRDAFATAGRGWGATGTNAWPLFRVDQVWTDDRVVPHSVRARKTTSSDHRLVICEVEIP